MLDEYDKAEKSREVDPCAAHGSQVPMLLLNHLDGAEVAYESTSVADKREMSRISTLAYAPVSDTAKDYCPA